MVRKKSLSKDQTPWIIAKKIGMVSLGVSFLLALIASIVSSMVRK